MQISTDPNSITVSDSGYICHSTMINSGTAEASLYYESGEFSESQYIVLAKAVDMSKIDPNSFRALIVAPDIKANKDFKISLEAIRNALLAKNISCQELLHKDATWENISVALQGGNLNYVYWIGHSDSQIGETRDPITLKIIKEGVHRTNFKCWKKGVLSDSLEDRIFSCMASDKITIPAVPEILPDNWEKKGHSMWSLKLWQTMRIKEFWVIGCESGLEWENAGVKYNHFNDMACAVGAYYQDNQGNYVHVYIGTRKPVWFGYLVEQAADYPSAIAHIIQRHANNHNLEDAINNGTVGSDEHIAIWGIEGIDERSIQWWPLTTKRDWIIFN
jgi:hypothetical protein